MMHGASGVCMRYIRRYGSLEYEHVDDVTGGVHYPSELVDHLGGG